MKYTNDKDTKTDKNRGTYSEHDHKVKLSLGVERGGEWQRTTLFRKPTTSELWVCDSIWYKLKVSRLNLWLPTKRASWMLLLIRFLYRLQISLGFEWVGVGFWRDRRHYSHSSWLNVLSLWQAFISSEEEGPIQGCFFPLHCSVLTVLTGLKITEK